MSEEITQVAPVEAPVTEAPAEAPEGTTTAAEHTLYELPDGKKVDAETLAKEFSQNFYPEYTRKSQELAAFRQKAAQQPTQEAKKAPWEENPEWTADSYDDLANPLVQKVTERVWKEIAEQAEAEQRQEQERAEAVQKEIEYIKSIDADADPNKIMSYAAKLQLPSLVTAWQSLKMLDEAVKMTEERVAKNFSQRATAPVGTTGAAGTVTPSFPPDVRTGYEKAKYLLKHNS